jgi:hypothetical protein
LDPFFDNVDVVLGQYFSSTLGQLQTQTNEASQSPKTFSMGDFVVAESPKKICRGAVVDVSSSRQPIRWTIRRWSIGDVTNGSIQSVRRPVPRFVKDLIVSF